MLTRSGASLWSSSWSAPPALDCNRMTSSSPWLQASITQRLEDLPSPTTHFGVPRVNTCLDVVRVPARQTGPSLPSSHRQPGSRPVSYSGLPEVWVPLTWVASEHHKMATPVAPDRGVLPGWVTHPSPNLLQPGLRGWMTSGATFRLQRSADIVAILRVL